MLITLMFNCRVHIAILYFNENANRVQATTLGGEARFNMSFPKYKGSGYVVKTVKVDPTFSKFAFYTLQATI